jgi:S1-C subfamily serine protease
MRMLKHTVRFSWLTLLACCLASPDMAAAAKKKPKPLPASEVFKQCSPAIVALDVFDVMHQQLGTATGFIVSSDGRLVTNHHVLEGARYVAVRMASGDVYDSVDIVEVDKRRDRCRPQDHSDQTARGGSGRFR